METLNARQQQRYAGTYRVVEKVDWKHIRDVNFTNPDWAQLYPLKPNGTTSGIFSPRLACKIFYDGIFILEKTEENMKYLQDKIPICAHKSYKKKQWRKQLIEACHRVLCRLAKGKGLNANCMAEELFVQVLIGSAVELGWNRSKSAWEALPECDKDRDINRIVRTLANEEINVLYRSETAPEIVNFKDWFRAINATEAAMHDHVIDVSHE